MLYFTADLHLDHKRILEIMKRPFGSLEEMNEALVANINDTVRGRDELYILGDFAFGNAAMWAGRIMCIKHLIVGNHDWKRAKPEMFDSMQDVKYLKWEGVRFFLSHYAHRTWRNSHHGSYHLYGHSHGMLPELGRSMDVGVDPMGFRPVSAEEVVERLKDREITLHHPR
jgi:calcineurin-like phosphoesterase family protein